MASPWRTAAARSLRLQSRSAVVWIVLLASTLVAIATGYAAAYPSPASRARIAFTIGVNPAFQALYGKARGLETVGGFTAWRAGGALVVIAGIWGLLTATRVTRGEEDAGRAELVRGGATSAAGALGAAVFGLGVVFAATGIALALACLASGLAAGGSFSLGFGIAAGFAVFAGLGLLAAELAETRRRAAALAGAALGVAFLVRVAADGTRTLGWLRWLAPFGWIEELRPFTGTRLGPVVPLVLVTALGVGGAFFVRSRRDLGGALLAERIREPSYALLGSPTGFTVRTCRGSVAAWSMGVGSFAFVFGLIAHDAAHFAASNRDFRRIMAQLGVGRLFSAEGFLGLSFAFIVVPVTLYTGISMGAVREEEAAGRLDNLLVRDVGRRAWLLTRVIVLAVGAFAVSVAAGASAWLGTAVAGDPVAPDRLAVAAANCLPVAVLFLGIGALGFASRPRATTAIVLGAIAVSYLAQLVGALVEAPSWLLDLSPFHHVAPAPAVPVNAFAAFVMVLVGVAAVALATERFARRDLINA